MGFLDYIFQTKTVSPSQEETMKTTNIEVTTPTEKQFVDYSDPVPNIPNNHNGRASTLDDIYEYVSTDFETQGYEDAFINPDNSYKEDNLDMFVEKLIVKIQQVQDFYQSHLKELEFHIQKNKNSGLIESVQELEMRKNLVDEKLERLAKIETETKEDTGAVLLLKRSYSRGFHRGIAAQSKSILNISL